jgi:hypothetical protein
VAAIVVLLLIWGLPVFVGHKIGAPKGRAGWAWGLLGWLGVIIVACLGPKRGAKRGFSQTTRGTSGPRVWPSATPAAALPAGWYADPAGGAFRRYWDGTQWTEDLAPVLPTPQ